MSTSFRCKLPLQEALRQEGPPSTVHEGSVAVKRYRNEFIHALLEEKGGGNGGCSVFFRTRRRCVVNDLRQGEPTTPPSFPPPTLFAWEDEEVIIAIQVYIHRVAIHMEKQCTLFPQTLKRLTKTYIGQSSVSNVAPVRIVFWSESDKKNYINSFVCKMSFSAFEKCIYIIKISLNYAFELGSFLHNQLRWKAFLDFKIW